MHLNPTLLDLYAQAVQTDRLRHEDSALRAGPRPHRHFISRLFAWRLASRHMRTTAQAGRA